jgi:hypothetical protein
MSAYRGQVDIELPCHLHLLFTRSGRLSALAGWSGTNDAFRKFAAALSIGCQKTFAYLSQAGGSRHNASRVVGHDKPDTPHHSAGADTSAECGNIAATPGHDVGDPGAVVDALPAT